eukprot:767971-Hanusia_phi.AAC.2
MDGDRFSVHRNVLDLSFGSDNSLFACPPKCRTGNFDKPGAGRNCRESSWSRAICFDSLQKEEDERGGVTGTPTLDSDLSNEATSLADSSSKSSMMLTNSMTPKERKRERGATGNDDMVRGTGKGCR